MFFFLTLVNCRRHYLTRLRLPLFSWTMEQMLKVKMGKVGSFYYLRLFVMILLLKYLHPSVLIVD